ncbi:MAG: uroporphyrinogen decarboxylase family protein [Sphaerochaeta sp.]|nr:uroporphyrinogen decarboxylase family protein [Sphaerochaeta sp.]
MRGRERVLNIVRGLSVDYPVAAPYMGNFAIRAAGKNLSECYQHGQALATAQLTAWDIFQQDVIVVQSDNYYMAEAFGATVEYARNAMPILHGAVIEHPGDVKKLEPVNPRTDGRMPVYIEAIARISDKVGDQAAIRGCGTGPFVLAGHLCGIERLLMWMIETDNGLEDHSDALHRLFSVGLETLIQFATAQLEAGATIIQLADSLASLAVISPEMFRKYVFPYEQKFFSRMHDVCAKHDSVALLHICGNNTKVFKDYVKTGADIIAIDHAADLAKAVDIIENRACIIGNMNPSGTLLFGSPADVTREALACLDTGHHVRYLLGTGCEVAPETPVENIQAMIAAAQMYQVAGGPL